MRTRQEIEREYAALRVAFDDGVDVLDDEEGQFVTAAEQALGWVLGLEDSGPVQACLMTDTQRWLERRMETMRLAKKGA